MKLTLLLAATAFFGVQELSAGVREMSLRSEGVKEESLGVQEFWSSGVQTNASDASNLSTRQLKKHPGQPTMATARLPIRCSTMSSQTPIYFVWAMTIILQVPPCTPCQDWLYSIRRTS